MRAEPSGATANRCRFQFAAATRTFAPFATPWQQPRFGHEVRISFGFDRFFQNVARCSEQLADGLLAQMGGVRGRVHACVEKNFICINVSDPGDQFLIEQGRFHCTAMFSQDLFELPAADVERVSTEK